MLYTDLFYHSYSIFKKSISIYSINYSNGGTNYQILKFKSINLLGILLGEPSYTNYPLQSIKIWSKNYNISVEGECIVVIMVIPF